MLSISHQSPQALSVSDIVHTCNSHSSTVEVSLAVLRETGRVRAITPDQLSACNKWELEGKTVNVLPYRVGQL